MLESQATSGDGGTDADPRLAALWTALATVIDPEIGLDLVTLGLVYGVEIDGDVAHITHTLTTPGCPMEHYITNGIREATALVARQRALQVVGHQLDHFPADQRFFASKESHASMNSSTAARR